MVGKTTLTPDIFHKNWEQKASMTKNLQIKAVVGQILFKNKIENDKEKNFFINSGSFHINAKTFCIQSLVTEPMCVICGRKANTCPRTEVCNSWGRIIIH